MQVRNRNISIGLEQTGPGRAGSGSVERTTDAQSPQSASRTPRSDSEASVMLSQRAMEAQRIRELVAAAPDIDVERVEALKTAIRDGTYRPDSRKIADAILEEALFMEGRGTR